MAIFQCIILLLIRWGATYGFYLSIVDLSLWLFSQIIILLSLFLACGIEGLRRCFGRWCSIRYLVSGRRWVSTHDVLAFSGATKDWRIATNYETCATPPFRVEIGITMVSHLGAWYYPGFGCHTVNLLIYGRQEEWHFLSRRVWHDAAYGLRTVAHCRLLMRTSLWLLRPACLD